MNCINKDIDENDFCTAIFQYIAEAFDKVWQNGLLFKLRQVLSINYFIFLKYYLSGRCFFIKQGAELTTLHAINAGVPQGSVLGPIL